MKGSSLTAVPILVVVVVAMHLHEDVGRAVPRTEGREPRERARVRIRRRPLRIPEDHGSPHRVDRHAAEVRGVGRIALAVEHPSRLGIVEVRGGILRIAHHRDARERMALGSRSLAA